MLAGCVMLLCGSCTLEAQANYHLTYDAPADTDGTLAYLYDWDTFTKLDSAIVSDGVVTFSGHIDRPLAANIIVGGDRGPIVFIESGEIAVAADGMASGTPLNDSMTASRREMAGLAGEYRSLNLNDSAQAERAGLLAARYDSIPIKAYQANSDNAYGLYMYMQAAYELPLKQLRADMAANPMLASSGQLKGLVNLKTARAASAEGARYKDFTVNWGDSVQTLSRYVTPARYTLVDFWASWCGPCRKQLPVLRDLYDRYHGRGLDVVGVAVWDRPDDSLAAIRSHDLPWPNIIDAQTVPTDLYGIQGIPCILLIGPDGVIVSREALGPQLVEIVEKAMEEYNQLPFPAGVTSVGSDSVAAPAPPVVQADTVPAF